MVPSVCGKGVPEVVPILPTVNTTFCAAVPPEFETFTVTTTSLVFGSRANVLVITIWAGEPGGLAGNTLITTLADAVEYVTLSVGTKLVESVSPFPAGSTVPAGGL